jgi:nitrile hydratase beta subunit
MDGPHDLGGRAGFGPVEMEPAEPVFHHAWERQVLSCAIAASLAQLYSGGRFRHSIERMDPGHYLTSSYYEHWLTGIATLLVEAGLVTANELDARAGGPFPLSGRDRGVAPGVERDRNEPRFRVGDRVRVREWHPPGHTRAPGYVQGKRGVVVRLDGAFSVPDVEAHSDRRTLDPTYSVRFTGEELWGEGAEPGAVLHVDLWEHYLEENT